MKKIITILIIFFIIFIGIEFYNSQKTIECWWGVMYPSLSFIPFEDEEQNNTKLSSNNPHYIYIKQSEEEPIKMKIAIVEWFKNTFGKGD